MKARQPIKTTAKKISTFQNRIGKNPNKHVVDVRPYGGYTSLAHKTEAGSHIEQNYSVNVENQMQLMKKISEFSTLNTTHMHMQLGQLEKELKQWEGKIGKVIKKKDSPLNFLRTPSVNNNFAISTNPVLKINASKSRFSKYGETVIKNANFWVEDVFGAYKSNLVFNQEFIENINNLEASMSQRLTEKWNEKTSYLVESLVHHLDRVDQTAVTSKTYYKSLKKQDTLNQTALDQLRSYYKSREKNQSQQWTEKDKTFVYQLNSVLEHILTEEMSLRIEKEYQKLVTEQEVYTGRDGYNHQDQQIMNAQSYDESIYQQELYESLASYYKVFEQNKWIKTLIMAQSPLISGDLYAGVSDLYQFINGGSSTIKELNEETTVESLYELVKGLKTENINRETKVNNLNQVLKTQTDLLNINTESVTVTSEGLDQLIKYLFVSHKKENIKEDVLNEIFLNRQVSEIVTLLNESKSIDTAYYTEINPINLAVLKSEYAKYYESNMKDIQKTLLWMNQILLIKDILVEETLTDLKSDVEKHIHDLKNVEIIQEYTREEIQKHVLRSQMAFEQNVNKINRWKQWFKEITHHYNQNGLGTFKVKQLSGSSQLTYGHRLLEDDYVIEGISKLSHYMEDLSHQFKSLTQTLDERQAYEDMAVQDTLKKIREKIENLVTYENDYMTHYVTEGEHKSTRVLENIRSGLLESIGGQTFIYKENIYEHMILQRDELKTLSQRIKKDHSLISKEKSGVLLNTIKKTQNKIASKHLELSSKLLINPEDMQVYYMTNGNTMRYAARALSYEDIMSQIEAKAYSGFSQMHSEIQNHITNLLASESMKKEMTQSIHYTAKHIHNMIQKLSQQIQQMLGSQTHVLNQRQLMTYSQLLFGENGVEAVTEKLVQFVERQYLKNMGLGNSSVSAYMNSSNEQIKRKLITSSNNNWIRNQFISPWIFQILQGGIQNRWSIPMLRATYYNRSMNQLFNRAGAMTYSGSYPVTYYPAGHYREDHHGLLHQVMPTYYQHPKWSETLIKGAKVFSEYAYERFDQLYAKLQTSDSFLQTVTADKSINNLMNQVIEKETPLILRKEIQQRVNQENTYGTSPSYYESGLSSTSYHRTDSLNRMGDSPLSNQHFYKKNESAHASEESTQNQYNTNIYNDTLIAYATELAESSTDELSKELLSQKELIEVIQSELAILREEKQVEEMSIDKLSDRLLKELSHKIRKDRQRKGWI